METVTETWRRVRQVSLVGMNSSKLDISSEVAETWLSSIISTIVTEQKENVIFGTNIITYCKGAGTAEGKVQDSS